MKQTSIILKLIIALFLCYGLVSCNSEDRKIKKVLKEYALEEGTKYKLSEYKIIETILKSNLEDSIVDGKISIEVDKTIMKSDSFLLRTYINQKEQCKTQQRNTLYYLKSSYDNIIDDWQGMIDEKEEDLNKTQDKLNGVNKKIENWESLIKNAETPIIYYVIKYKYILDGRYLEKKVLLTTKHKIL